VHSPIDLEFSDVLLTENMDVTFSAAYTAFIPGVADGWALIG